MKKLRELRNEAGAHSVFYFLSVWNRATSINPETTIPHTISIAAFDSMSVNNLVPLQIEIIPQ